MRNSNIKLMTQLALLIAIEAVMKLTGLHNIPLGPINMSLLTIPVAIGAIVLGPLSGAVLGFVFGALSFMDAITGASAMTSTFMTISAINTFILCVVMRTLMGWCVGLIYAALKKVMKSNVRYFIAAACAPLLNTLFFMGYIVIAFYNTDYIQALCTSLGATNPLIFVALLVGMQGLIEACGGCIIGGITSKAVDVVVNRNK